LAFVAVTVAVCAVFQDGASAQDAATCSQLRSQIAQLDQSIANMRSAGSSGSASSSVNNQVGLLVNQRETLRRTYNSYCTGSSGSNSSPSTGGGGDQVDAAIGLLGTVLGMVGSNNAADRERAAREREMEEYAARERARIAEEEARREAERLAAEQAARERDARMRQATLNPFDPAGGGGAANPFGGGAQNNPFASPQQGEELIRARYTPIMNHWGQSYPRSCPSGEALANYCAAPPIWWGSQPAGAFSQQQCINYVRSSTMHHPYCIQAARRDLRDARGDIDEAVRQARCAEGRAPRENCDDDPDNDVDWD
jgi:hypothetical protein